MQKSLCDKRFSFFSFFLVEKRWWKLKDSPQQLGTCSSPRRSVDWRGKENVGRLAGCVQLSAVLSGNGSRALEMHHCHHYA